MDTLEERARRLYRKDMTPEEHREADRKFWRIVNLVFNKLQFLPEEHKADIRELMEKELPDGQAG